MQGWYYIECLTGQRHDRVQTESQELQPWTAVSNLLSLISTVLQAMKYSVVRLLSTYSLNAEGDDLRWNSNPNFCQLANITCETRDKGQKEKSRISCRCRDKETADRHKLVPQENRKVIAYESLDHIGSKFCLFWRMVTAEKKSQLPIEKFVCCTSQERDNVTPPYYMVLSRKDWELPNSRIWLVEMDIDRGLDFPI